MRLLAWIRSYVNSSPVPMRTVAMAAFLLSMLFVFTSFIGRTQLGTNMSAFDWWHQAPIPFLNFFTWTILLPLVYRWSRRWSLREKPPWRSIITHIGLGTVLCLFHELWTNTLYLILLGPVGKIPVDTATLTGLLLMLPAAVVQRFMEYWLLLVLLMYVDTQRLAREQRTRVLQLQNELQTTQIHALKKQLQPHFLYNTLNTVSALMDEDRNGARIVLSRLGQLLRSTLDEERHETVPLIHEVDHTSYYLGIETVRFKDRLKVYYDIPSNCQNALVPGMILQPLVENSIKHGLNNTSDAVAIHITASREGDKLLLEVADNGKGAAVPAQPKARAGIGLRNVNERLHLLYGQDCTFHAEANPGKGFLVRITIPYATKGHSRA